MIGEYLADVVSTVSAVIVNIPVDNTLGAIYVVIQNLLLLVLSIMGYNGDGISIFPSSF